MTDCRPGEIVDVAIKGVRVLADHDTYVVITDEHGIDHAMPSQAAITRVAPSEWPPQLGDLWRDRDGDLWFAFQGYGPDNEKYVGVRCVDDKPMDAWGDHSAWCANGTYRPLTLVRREKGAT